MTILSTFKALDPVWGISTAAGSVLGNLVEYAPLPEGAAKFAGTVQKVANMAVFPDIVSQTIDFATDVKAAASGDAEALESAFFGGLSLVGSGCDGLQALHDVGAIEAGDVLPVLGTCSNVITVITSGHDCVTQVKKLQKYEVAEGKVSEEKVKKYYVDKQFLALMILVKKVLSISMALIGLISLFFGSFSLFGVLLITGSVVYLTINIAECFYSKTLKNEKERIAHLLKK